MKKLLLSTAAVAGASALATSAFALPIQSVNDAGTPVLTAGMAAQFEAGFVDNDMEPEGVTRDMDFVNGRFGEIYFNGEMTADNGLVYGAKIHFATDNRNLGGGDNNNSIYPGREYMYFKGGWGSVELGNWPGADTGLTLTPLPQGYTGIGGLDLAYKSYAYQPAGSINHAASPLWWDAGNSKVTYYTPALGGFQAGISFTPSTLEADPASGIPSDSGETTDKIAYGVKWSGDFGGATVALAAVGATSDDVTTMTDDGESTTMTTTNGIDAYDISARLNYAGLQVGAAFWNADDHMAAAGDGQEYSGWSMNAIYTFGPLGVEVQYASAEKSANMMTSNYDAWAISVGYSVAPGLKWYGELIGVEFDNDGDATDNEALVALSGLMLSF